MVGIADDITDIEDPNSINLDEVAKMGKECIPLSAFPPSKLSSADAFDLANTPKYGRARSTLHDRVAADVLIPCNDYLQTINETDWGSYLVDDAVTKSSSKVIIKVIKGRYSWE